MLNKFFRKFLLITLPLFFFIAAYCQTIPKDSGNYIIKRASDKYNTGSFHNFLWGRHYRTEWYTPVTFKKVMLDTLYGGLTPYKTGGGRQSKSIRVTDKNKREYVFRSIDKTFGGALPDITQGTFMEHVANDQVTIAHPYANMIVAPLAEAAKIYHATPSLYYVPKQKALGELSDSTGNELYSFEKRPDENWTTEPDFGSSKNIVSTDKMLEKILDDNDNSIDQQLFAKSRLFDMFIGDWGRHEDQWRWASFKDKKKTLYAPIPRDRDNAFSVFDGLLIHAAIRAAGAKHLQTFDYKIKDVDRLNFPARNLDHHLLNEVTEEQWIAIAKDMQANITDAVIENAVKQMPPEVYPISGPEIAAKLKARRDDLVKYADKYYKFLAKEVEVTGTKKDESFEIKRLSNTETEVNIYKITRKGETKDEPVYHRIFKTKETNEIRLYGIAGNDEFHVSGKVKKGIKVRMIGGPEKDKYVDESKVSGPSHKTKIYDLHGNDIRTTKETAVNLSFDSSITRYDYKYFNYNKKGVGPVAFYDFNDKFYVGIAFNYIKYKWRKYPEANIQHFDVKYSLTQKAFSTTYSNTFVELLGKWNLTNYINYDDVRWTNFYGLGNENVIDDNSKDYYRSRDRELNSAVGLNRVFKNKHKLFAGVFYQNYKLINDTARFVAKQFSSSSAQIFNTYDFGGFQAGYVYQSLNDSVLPIRGISLGIDGNYTNNLRSTKGNVVRYNAQLTWYAPLSQKFGLVIRGGGSTLTGSPEFFQYNKLGGTDNLRGYQRDRFYGKSTAYSQNELRWITNFRSHVFNGKIGLFALYDAGRVWLDGENSNTWHTGYGGGIILSPFNKISISVAYAVSNDDSNIHLKLLKGL